VAKTSISDLDSDFIGLEFRELEANLFHGLVLSSEDPGEGFSFRIRDDVVVLVGNSSLSHFGKR
jgi:hypothetical protein